MSKLDLEKAEEPILQPNCQQPLDHRKSKRIPDTYILLENPRLLSPQRPPPSDFFSTCLGINSLNGVITHLEPDILECKVKWALGSITMNKASGVGGIPGELFQILKDDAVKVHSICQQI